MRNLRKQITSVAVLNLLVVVVSICTFIQASAASEHTLRDRGLDVDAVLQGKVLFEAHCASCHGVGGSGPTVDWRQRDANGDFPPPPLNGSAHTWHHSKEQLMTIIQQGQGNMPAWGSILNQTQRLKILSYIQSLWPDAVFVIWRDQWNSSQ